MKGSRWRRQGRYGCDSAPSNYRSELTIIRLGMLVDGQANDELFFYFFLLRMTQLTGPSSEGSDVILDVLRTRLCQSGWAVDDSVYFLGVASLSGYLR